MAFLALAVPLAAAGFGGHGNRLGFSAALLWSTLRSLHCTLVVDFAAATNFLAMVEDSPAAMSFFILALAN